MRISVVTPSFNMGRYLEDTIASVLANLRDGDEYFVIDGGSTDESLDIIKRHEKRLTGWVSQPDNGYADAIAKGFARASGDILCWINAGDLYLAGAFDAARTMFEPGMDLIFGDDFYVDENNKILAFSRGWVPDLRAAMLYGGWTPLQDSCFWRRELYHKIGGMDARLRYAADYDLFLRMALAGCASYVPVTFSAFRRHAGQKSISGLIDYNNERRRTRNREIKAMQSGKFSKALYGGINRLAMSARARLGPLRWRRPDLVGTSVTALPCGAYWPAKNQF
ncbi:glycosyltransferase family 2 protein [Bradyrhizobium erythrophlei]|uniref:Glycosyltransferase involved in cell wall bisynthesis n=1 Tax=Bradyrhizobium erythrophlei TaxID=1437360 RepID=A0A1M7UHS0_9BRAD|nr:glycosyltransferase family 2 protein [Bradyrhizobium erythrophlei]SHN82450.1 Glycosyltransferase involved in cell wall bisynthesis [Bradyrhizobium erythrophlei]